MCWSQPRAEYGNYNWAEAENAWWAYTTATISETNLQFRDMALSSDGYAMYVIGNSKEQPPSVSPWPSSTCGNPADHSFLLVFDISGAIIKGEPLVGSDCEKADMAFDLQLAPAATGQSTDDDVVYVTGHSDSISSTIGEANVGLSDAFLAKFTIDRANGYAIQKDWVVQQGTTGIDVGYSVAVDSTGSDVYVAGFTYGTFVSSGTNAGGADSATADMFLLKIDNAGNLAWASLQASDSPNTPEHDVATRVAVDGTGVYVAGRTRGDTPLASTTTAVNQGGFDWTLSKVDASTGNILWRQHLGNSIYNSNRDEAITGLELTDSGVILTGTYNADASPMDEPPMYSTIVKTYTVRTFITKLDSSDGSPVWSRHIRKSTGSPWSDATTLDEFSSALIPFGTAGQYIMGGYANYYNATTSYEALDGVFAKTFNGSAPSASLSNPSSIAFETTPQFLPNSFQSRGYPIATYLTGIAVDSSSSSLYICGFAKYQEGTLLGPKSRAPFVIKLVQPPPSREQHRALI